MTFELNLNAKELAESLASYPLRSVSNFFPSKNKLQDIVQSGYLYYQGEHFWLLLQKHDTHSSLYYLLQANDLEEDLLKMRQVSQLMLQNLSFPAITVLEQVTKGLDRRKEAMVIAESIGFKPYIARKRLRLELTKGCEPFNLSSLPSGFSIDYAAPEEADEILNAYRDVFEPYTSCIQPFDMLVEQILDQRLMALRHVDPLGEKKLAGIIEYSANGKKAHIIHVLIYPDYRRRGLSSQLTKALLSQLIEKDFRLVELWVQIQNEAALRMYHGLDFREDGWLSHAFIHERTN